METLFESLLKMYPLPDSLQVLPPSQLFPPRGSMTIVEGEQIGTLLPQEPATTYHEATLVKNERVTSSTWYQDVRELTFHFDSNLE